ncbi:ABC transporter permease [Calothrix sp. CCY 0018]|uniref:ABC transporter permease n=1 Tax=Calothrix sp. CCY 0018 TaxID=3103864 RepID=UPI0039C67F92
MTTKIQTSQPNDYQKIKTRKSSQNWFQALVLLAPAALTLLLLLVLPTLIIIELSFVPGIRPGDIVNPSGFENYLRILDPLYLQVIKRSLLLALATTGICLVIGFPVAFWIARMAPKRWRNLLLLAFILPLWTSSLLRSYAWITILRPTGLLNTVLADFNLPTLDLLNSTQAVLIGMSYNLLPYMVLILYASLERLDQRLLEAASDLGANSIQVFARVTVPQVLPGIAAASMLVFITGLGDYVNPELLGGAASMTAARLIYNQFLGTAQNWGFGSALSTVLILLVSLAIAFLIKFGEGAPER